MFDESARKLIILQVLDVLKRYSDAEHKLSQKEICDIIKRDYGYDIDRKSVKRNISELIDFGFEIEYKLSIRKTEKKDRKGRITVEESEVWNDFYLIHEFDESELRLLIDSILFSKHIPKTQCKTLINKLEGLSSKYFKSRVKHISQLLERDTRACSQLFYNIEIIDEAISGKKQISFNYSEYGADKKIHPRLTSDGKVREYVINPFQIAAANGRYYLICNNDKYDDVSNYRLDRITDIKLLDTRAKDVSKVKGLENGIDLTKHMSEHIYMFQGKSVYVRFRLKKELISEVVDWFGNDVRFSDENEKEVTAHVNVNFEAMRKWALQFALDTEILYPKELVDAVKEDIKKSAEKYEINV